ncbi:hypothetical protein [Streptomyces sp. NPDC047718]|uniref:hypothetical protein n=1 Tax=Streptomyces sp. NPDC047718 TaxID=3155479 RepID=UPI00340959E4
MVDAVLEQQARNARFWAELMALDDLDAKDRLLDLCEAQGGQLDPALLNVLVQFAAPFHDHPDHPEYTWAAR